jgi:CxxC motif-containing protein (DUF1111 family)
LTPEPGEEFSGGDTTVFDTSPKAFGFPARNLKDERRASFFVGHSFFNENWVVAPASTAGRDGLGPLFNTRSCSACHFQDGRSRPPKPGEAMVTMLMRISVPGVGPHQEPVPDPAYGGQIQGQAVPGVPREADVYVKYEETPGRFADGHEYFLRQPVYAVTNLGYGPLAKDMMMSPRVAPTMIGLGLLEAVPEETLRALAARHSQQSSVGANAEKLKTEKLKSDSSVSAFQHFSVSAFKAQDSGLGTPGGGIAGRINFVWDETARKTVPGRYGWKAEQPTVRQQTAGAFVGDMGITSSLMPDENNTARQEICARQPSGGHPEVSDKILNDVVIYSRTLAVPARRNWTDPTVLRGKALFAQASCAACHVPKLQTGDCPDLPELSNQTIRPYTDLLLHDMGEGLADNRPVFEASGRDWRTPPLWGIGLVSKVNGHTFFLHDGRARNLTEAILWHGGEAEAAREKFRSFSQADREAMIAFLESL